MLKERNNILKEIKNYIHTNYKKINQKMNSYLNFCNSTNQNDILDIGINNSIQKVKKIKN